MAQEPRRLIIESAAAGFDPVPPQTHLSHVYLLLLLLFIPLLQSAEETGEIQSVLICRCGLENPRTVPRKIHEVSETVITLY